MVFKLTKILTYVSLKKKKKSNVCYSINLKKKEIVYNSGKKNCL